MKAFESLVGSSTRAAIENNLKIKQVIASLVPATAMAHIVFCRLEGGRLRVTVDNAAWVAKLRFSERLLITALKAEKKDIHTISWHIAPVEQPITRSTRRTANKPHPRSAAMVDALANSSEALSANHDSKQQTDVTGDRLRQELLKLAAKLRQS